MFLASWSSICGSWAWDQWKRDNKADQHTNRVRLGLVCVHSRAWLWYCEGWVHGVVWCWSARSLSSSCRQTWTPGINVLLHKPTAVQKTGVTSLHLAPEGKVQYRRTNGLQINNDWSPPYKYVQCYRPWPVIICLYFQEQFKTLPRKNCNNSASEHI